MRSFVCRIDHPYFTSFAERSHNLVRSHEIGSVARFRAVSPRPHPQFMTSARPELSRQVQRERRADMIAWLRAALVATAIFAAGAAAQPQPEPELPQPEEAPLLITRSAIGDIDYRPGRGISFGDTGLTLGGFATLGMTKLEGDHARFSLDGLDLFVFFDPSPYLHFFSDISFEKLVEIDENGGDDGPGPDVIVRRLYGELNLTDRANFRFGEYLTPVGRWNQIPAAPLTWTTSRPLVTDQPFDLTETGAEFWGSLFPPGGSLTYTFYGQFLEPPTEEPDNPPADYGAGARLEYSALSGWSLGSSYFSSVQNGRWNYLGGLDGLWRTGRFELSGEFLGGHGDPVGARIFGLYVQGVVRVVDSVYGIARYEYYDPGTTTALDLFDVGVAWRPFPILILKADYLFSNTESDLGQPGLRASISLLF